MQSKMERIAVSKRSDYQTIDFTKELKFQQSQEPQDEKAKLDEYHKTIYPWIQCYSKATSKYYFYNPDSGESVWSLSKNLQREANSLFHLKSIDTNETFKKNYQLFLRHDRQNNKIETMHNGKDYENVSVHNSQDEKMNDQVDELNNDDLIDEQDDQSDTKLKQNPMDKYNINLNTTEHLINDDQKKQLQQEIKNTSQENNANLTVKPDLIAVEENKINNPPQEQIQLKNYKTDWKSRPAPVQFDTSLTHDLAYRERDRDYNIWYDKFIEDEIVLQREGAKTRCNPILQSGYTMADTYDRGHRNFCIHFARGNCFLGVGCGYFHHIPTLEDCMKVDNGKDIFGRSRYATHRADNQGIGNFMKETRTLRITDFCTPNHLKNAIEGAYEMLWRHFSMWGNIEDIFLIASTNIAFIRYNHRCMAEFAKVAMSDQPLDADEILTIKWTNDDCFNLEDVEAQELDEAGKAQKKSLYEIEKRKLAREKPGNDANITQRVEEREIKISRKKLTMEEYYREQDLNWNYKRTRERQAEFSQSSISAPFNLFEQKLKEGEKGKMKLDILLKARNETVKQQGNYSFKNFMNEKNIPVQDKQ